MIDPAIAMRTYLGCNHCGSKTRADIAIGLDGISRCNGCGNLLDPDEQTAPVAPPSSIVARRAFRSASLIRRERGTPL